MTETYHQFIDRKINNIRKKAKERFGKDITVSCVDTETSAVFKSFGSSKMKIICSDQPIGEYFYLRKKENREKLKLKTVWVNIYSDCIHMLDSKEACYIHESKGRLACKQITFYEGEGL